MKILAFPRDDNPYQELLYGPMRKRGVSVDYLDGPTGSHTINLLLMPFMVAIWRIRGYKIFHLHWVYLFSLPWGNRSTKKIMQAYYQLFFYLLKALGYKIVWTCHNFMPHEQVFYDDLKARKFLGKITDRIIVHNNHAKKQLRDLKINTEKITEIPHGSYVGYYPDSTTKSTARKKLGLEKNDNVILFFGKIRPYKGIESLMDSYSSLRSSEKPTLLIAGASQEKVFSKKIRKFASREPKVHLFNQHIPDEDIQYYFGAADFTILPYLKSTTSAVALLSCSFGRPVIAPQLDVFEPMPRKTKITYRILADGIISADKVSNVEKSKMNEAAKDYANSLSWTRIAQKTLESIEMV